MLKLPGYTMVERLHEGPTTAVYRARRDADGVTVALKLLRGEHPGPAEVERLRREYTTLRGLVVPGLPRVFGLETLDGRLCMVMESLSGRPLDEVLAQRRLPLVTALQVGVVLADVIGRLHLAGVIHKDIKPHNVLVDLDAGEVRLIDLGVAVPRSQAASGREEALEGTLEYLAPEQTGRMNRRVDHRADLYSLGVTLYEMVTGALPFAASDPLELVHSHVARTPTPPHVRAPELPRVVSDIIVRLLAKAAEDRYQSAFGLQADLERCRERLATSGRVDPFALGRSDRGDELRLSPRLHGREAAHAQLLAAWRRASGGAAEMLLLAGPSGVGKSALVDAVRSELARAGGVVIAGKCDQLNRGTPYAPLERACQELVRRVLTEPPAALAEVRARLVAALGAHGRVVADIVPEIELVIGAQRPVPELGPAESRNRLNLAFQRFLAAFCAPQRPLTLFLDDLQWADPATLKLLAALLTDPDGAHLFVIGACRDGEVDADHPLTAMLTQLRGAGRPVAVVPLAPLTAAEVAAFVGETLGCPADEVAPLAALLRDRTGGNPFFVGRLLLGLFHDGLLGFDTSRGAWLWDLDAVRLATGDDVLAFVTGKLQALAPETQRVLQFAACIGHEFADETLVGALAEAAVDVARALAEATRGGLLVAGDGAHRFVHDRVQQAAHAQIDAAQRPAVHLRVGRLLRARLGPEPRDDELFAVVHHLNQAAALISDHDERGALLRLDVAAGRKARTAAAFEAAAGYFAAAAALLVPDSWERDHAATFEIHAAHADCTYLCGRLEQAEAAFASLLTRARTPEQRLLLEGRRMDMRISQSRFAEAVDLAIAVLAPLGVHLPATEEARMAALGPKLGEIEALVGDREVASLLGDPRLSDPLIEAEGNLLMTACMAGYYTSATTYAHAAAEQVILSLKHGNSPQSPIAYAAYAFVLGALYGRHARAEAFIELALALHAQSPDPRVESKLYHLSGTLLHYRRPVRVALAHLERARAAGLEYGDFVFLSAAADNAFPYKFALGVPLAELREDTAQMLALVHRTRDALSIAYLTIARQLVAALEGRTRGPTSLDGDGFVEEGFAAGLARDGLYPIACWCHCARTMLAYLHGDLAGAAAAAAAAEPLAAAASGQYFPTELAFFACLIAVATTPGDPGALARRDELLARNGALVATWAASCPANYGHKHALLTAELARLAGRHDEATDAFERAIAGARAEGFVRDEALAFERAALFHLGKQRPRIARVYLAEAHAAYVRWGATVKAALLAEQHPDLLRDAPPTAAAPTAGLTLTRLGSTGLVDAATLVRAAQALVGEVVLSTVLERLVRLVVESAGAQRGVLLLAQGDGLQVVARLDDDRVMVGEPLPLAQASDLAASIVRYVARTREAVVLDDAILDHRFVADPYIGERRPRSVLCLALTQHDRLTGVVYLEHNAASGAFTHARVDLAGLLASLAATAVANAQLYARVDEVTQALRGANESLEDEVARRTEDLRASNGRLEVELAERARAEQARGQLHAQIVRMQEERLAELSTPILPISDRVVVMPLIGTMDAQRGRQVLEAALMGARELRAEVVILDVTGMKLVDAEVADMLAATAGALELLGARALVTGLSPEVAWAFVARGEALAGVTTVATLKAAVAQAAAPREPSRPGHAHGATRRSAR